MAVITLPSPLSVVTEAEDNLDLLLNSHEVMFADVAAEAEVVGNRGAAETISSKFTFNISLTVLNAFTF